MEANQEIFNSLISLIFSFIVKPKYMKQNIRYWILAARPKTLPAAVIPVIIGTSFAYRDHSFDFIPALVALICAILIQIGTNFANDYYDYKKGTDDENRIGFKRATSSGWIAPDVMLKATKLTMLFAFILGLYLVWHAGIVVLVIGILSLIFGIVYTGGPYPLGYNGLGDVFVFIFFGIIAVMTTYYVQALDWSIDTFWASLAIGALSTNILVVNNLRDIETDAKTGKRTLGVMFGEVALKTEYTLMMAIALIIPLVLRIWYGFDTLILLPILLLPGILFLLNTVWRFKDRKNLNDTLVKTAAFMTVYGLVLTVGILAS